MGGTITEVGGKEWKRSIHGGFALKYALWKWLQKDQEFPSSKVFLQPRTMDRGEERNRRPTRRNG